MMKIILFVAVVAVIIAVFRSNARKKRGPDPEKKPPSEASMTRCANCGVHFPLSEALSEKGRNFCCEGHRKLGASD